MAYNPSDGGCEMTSVTINKKGKKWTVSVFWACWAGRSEKTYEFDGFKKAYGFAARNYADVNIGWHPDWMQKQIDSVKKEIEDEKQEEQKRKDLKQLDSLQKKYRKDALVAQ
jgi:hypothetical protein